MELQFQRGDVVRLKCGGPKMVIAGTPESHWIPGYFICEWIDEDGIPVSINYHQDMLEDAPTTFD